MIKVKLISSPTFDITTDPPNLEQEINAILATFPDNRIQGVQMALFSQYGRVSSFLAMIVFKE